MNEETEKETAKEESITNNQLMVDFGDHLQFIQTATKDIDVQLMVQDGKFSELLLRCQQISDHTTQLAIIVSSLSLRRQFSKKL